MEFNVASARRVGERWGASDDQVGAAAAGVLLLQACDEIERLRQHRCLWGNDPSGPTFSDEYLESLEALSDTVAALPLQRYQPEVK